MPKKTKKQIKLDEDRIGKIFGQVAANRQVPIMSLSKIMNAGMEVLNAGGDDAAIGEAIKVVVDKVAEN